MDTLSELRAVIRRLFHEWEQWPGPESKFRVVPVFDESGDHYLLLMLGWDGHRHIHDTLVHLDILDGKVWVQEDNTEQGFAVDLVAAGVPKDRIVLGFKSPERRRDTEFAVA